MRRLLLLLGVSWALIAAEPDATDATWQDAVAVLDNGPVQVAADARHGGRLVAYTRSGRNALYVDSAHPEQVFPDDNRSFGPAGGRFDIGPEEALPAHPVLWSDAWTVERSDALHLRLSSAIDAATGVQLSREFSLDPATTHLRCTQTIRNGSDRTLRRAYWGRTLAPGGGIFVTALTPGSRFPNRFIQYTDWRSRQIVLWPQDPTVSIHDDLLVQRGVPLHPKLGLDAHSGWMAYLLPSGLLFVKRFAVYPERRYADIAGLTMAFYKLEDRIVELEPLGPEEVLPPGRSAAFSEDWWLLEEAFPKAGEPFDPARIRDVVEQQTKCVP